MIVSIKELKITEKRYNEIIDLYNELSLIDSRKLIDKKILTYPLLIKIIVGLPKKDNIYLYIDENDDIIGGITLLIEQKLIHNGGRVGHIEDFVVSENYREKGIGGLLLNYVVNMSERGKCYKCILDCSTLLEGFYTKKGFTKKGSYMAKYF